MEMYIDDETMQIYSEERLIHNQDHILNKKNLNPGMVVREHNALFIDPIVILGVITSSDDEGKYVYAFLEDYLAYIHGIESDVHTLDGYLSDVGVEPIWNGEWHLTNWLEDLKTASANSEIVGKLYSQHLATRTV